MNPAAVSRRYALTLLDTAVERGVLAQVVRDADALRATLTTSSELTAFLENRLLAGENHLRAFETLFADRVDGLTRSFLRLVATRRRGHLLAPILEQFITLAEQRMGTVRAEVRCAVAMDAQQVELLRERLTAFAGRHVNLEVAVDPAVGSGAVVRMGDTIIDGTVATRLEHLRRRLVGA
jgi:F-type H+-transporting ATPase subunit delta